MSELFDFGFTAVTEEELESTQTAKAAEATAAGTTERLDKLYNAVIPLLSNLKKNPEKEYILWPNRLAKVEEFETFITKIYNGE